MNKRGANLTSMVLGILAFIAILSLAMYAQSSFNAGIDYTGLTGVTQNSSTKYNQSLSNMSNQKDIMAIQILDPLAPDQNILTTAYNTGTSLISTAVIGVTALFQLLYLPGIVVSLLTQIQNNLPLGQAGVILFWFFSSAMTFYVVMKVVQAIRGVNSPA